MIDTYIVSVTNHNGYAVLGIVEGMDESVVLAMVHSRWQAGLIETAIVKDIYPDRKAVYTSESMAEDEGFTLEDAKTVLHDVAYRYDDDSRLYLKATENNGVYETEISEERWEPVPRVFDSLDIDNIITQYPERQRAFIKAILEAFQDMDNEDKSG
ncbi:MAG: hypothetical protein AAF125_02685 [Chloroflexota bacterium]